jgi:hypothetical protein
MEGWPTHTIRNYFRLARQPVMASELNSAVTFELYWPTQVYSITMYGMHSPLTNIGSTWLK